ncbi:MULTISPECIES: energy-coupling factor transporter transmembrane component T family protein [Thioclava]|uniref:Energy-coupling factor transporter transmembrane protein EcfT n=1 Tax=Thioclava kandeliae TaxID=3070818 RepID=A0ABV1SJ23_9RHOB
MISLTSPIETRAHRWPAGPKLAGLCLATALLFALPSLPLQLAAFAIIALLYLLPGLRFAKAGAKALRPLWPIALVLALWHGLTADWAEGARIVLRFTTAVALANLVTMTTRLADMLDTLHWLTRPLAALGVNTRAGELAIALTIRFTPILAQKGQMLAQSWRARSAKRANWHLVLPLGILALDDAEHVAEALRARGGVNPAPPSAPKGGDPTNGT